MRASDSLQFRFGVAGGKAGQTVCTIDPPRLAFLNILRALEVWQVSSPG